MTDLEKLERDRTLGLIEEEEYKKALRELSPPKATTLPDQHAYPFFYEVKGVKNISMGLTKREYFAAKMMAAIISSIPNNETITGYSAIAREAVEASDALINALNESKR